MFFNRGSVFYQLTVQRLSECLHEPVKTSRSYLLLKCLTKYIYRHRYIKFVSEGGALSKKGVEFRASAKAILMCCRRSVA